MKYPTILLLSLVLFACNQPGTPGEQTAEPEPAQPTIPPTPPVDTSASLRDTHNKLRMTLRMELPNTLPARHGDRTAQKSYSFDLEEQNGQPVWVVKEKLYDPASGDLYAGAEYLMLWSAVDPASIQLTRGPDGQRLALVIRPKPGNSFVYHPYSQQPDKPVAEVLLGWYEPVQSQTLGRALALFQQLTGSMQEWETGY